jgi:hypothetical protein
MMPTTMTKTNEFATICVPSHDTFDVVVSRFLPLLLLQLSCLATLPSGTTLATHTTQMSATSAHIGLGVKSTAPLLAHPAAVTPRQQWPRKLSPRVPHPLATICQMVHQRCSDAPQASLQPTTASIRRLACSERTVPAGRQHRME